MSSASFEIASEDYCGHQQEATALNVELFQAAQQGNLQGLQKALEQGANPNFIDQHGEGNPVALHEAVRIEDEATSVECTRLLLEKGAETSLQLISSRNTPLHEAITHGTEDVCRLLIEAGASIESQNAFGNTPLHAAVRAGRIEMVRLLLNHGADPNAINHRGSRPLHICAVLSSDNIESDDDKSLLNLEIAKVLLSAKSRQTIVDSRDTNGYTPLHYAAQRGCIRMIQLLVDSGANLLAKTIVDEKGRGGRTPYGMAKLSNKEKAMELLKIVSKIE